MCNISCESCRTPKYLAVHVCSITMLHESRWEQGSNPLLGTARVALPIPIPLEHMPQRCEQTLSICRSIHDPSSPLCPPTLPWPLLLQRQRQPFLPHGPLAPRRACAAGRHRACCGAPGGEEQRCGEGKHHLTARTTRKATRAPVMHTQDMRMTT